MAAVKQKPIYDVELHHKTKEPVWSWPNHLIWFGKKVGEHSKQGYNILGRIGSWSYGHVVNHDESCKARHHHPQQLEIVKTDETPRRRLIHTRYRRLFIFQCQSKTTEK